MAIRGVAFDLEGTAIDVEQAHHEGHLAAAADVGVHLTLDQALETIPHFIGGPDSKIAEEIWHLSDKKEAVSFILARDRFHYEQFLREVSIQSRAGFCETVSWLIEWRYKVAIGSLTASHHARFLLERAGLVNLFRPEQVVLAEDVQNLKPAPDVFFETARRMGVQPVDQLVFEDSPNGIRAAVRAGSRAIGMPVYNRPEAVVPLIEAGAVRVFMDWREIEFACLLKNLETS